MSEDQEETASVISSEEDSTQHNVSSDSSSQYAGDNSIIGKVKSRVSSILPNRISKWFTTASTSNNSSLNGSFMSTSILAKRRRHVDDDEDDIDTEDNEENNDDTNEGSTNRTKNQRYQNSNRIRSNIENDISEPVNHVNDDNYEEDEANTSKTKNNNFTQKTSSPSKDGNSTMDPYSLRQPPTKRSRFENLMENDNSSPLMISRQQFVSSTPATHSINMRQHLHADSNVQRSSYKSHNRYTTNTKLNNTRTLQKEPAYDFTKTTPTTMTSTIKTYNVLNNRQESHSTTSNIYLEQSDGAYSQPSISSRKILNIPPLSSISTNLRRSERFRSSALHLKRQPLSSVKMKTDTELTTSNHAATHALCDIINDNEDDYDDGNNIDAVNDGKNVHRSELSSNSNSYTKEQKLVNGSDNRANETIILVDTSSESDDSNDDTSMNNRNIVDNDDHEQFNQRKVSSYNFTTKTSSETVTNSNVNDNSNKRRYEHDYDHARGHCLGHHSRTSSYGNDLNFYSHLEGHKSLFGGSANSTRRGTANDSFTLNNSTLSLSSLSRRQFNASIYGSTSALSDSRLLNTFSPFYKGRTTYGGAAAYNKNYCGIGSGSSMGASSAVMRLTPTIIRPTSNLSTTNNTHLNTTGHHLFNPSMSDNNSAISSTAQRILELITDINTPLSDAKKMAHSLRPTPPQARKRLNDIDVNSVRSAVRLSRAPKPYSRPSSAVLLQSKRSGYGSGHGSGNLMTTGSSTLPPIKELQVPSMSQLLQMKRMQNITEKARRITTQNIQNNLTVGGAAVAATTGICGLSASSSSSALYGEYDLPLLHGANRKEMSHQRDDFHQQQDQEQQQKKQQQQQQHTNKIKNKINLADEVPPAPPNLPDIKFPLMQSKPTFDIQLPIVTASTVSSLASSLVSTSATIMTPVTSQSIITSKTSGEFQFSLPLPIDDALTPSQNDKFVAANCINNYNFSMPTYMSVSTSNGTVRQSITLTTPQPLKDGSVLDVLYKKSPFNISNVDMPATSTNPKSTNDWECNTCWVRNKIDMIKCVACGMQKSSITTTITPTTVTSITIATTIPEKSSLATSSNLTAPFGNQFKRSNGEWDCDMCMIRNKMDATRCVACEAQRKNVTSSTQLATATSVNNTFGDAFKSKGNTWECKTCLIMNNIEVNECVACQSRRPGSTLKADPIKANASSISSSVPFKFGFSNAENHTSTIKAPPATADAEFKALASQQKQSKWECEACMTRNDASRKKCVCCEQPRSGFGENIDNTSLSNGASTAKFVFGATVKSTNYTFGFGPILGTQKEEDLKKESSNHASVQNTNSLVGSQMVADDTGKKFQTQSQFQLQPAKDKDIADGVNNLQRHESSQITAVKTITTSSTFISNLQKPFESSNATSTTTATTLAIVTSANATVNLMTTSNSNNVIAATPETSTTSTTIPSESTTATTTTITFNSENRLNCNQQQKPATGENMFKTFSQNFSNASNTLGSGSGFTFGSVTPNKQQVPLTNVTANNATVTPSTAISTTATTKSTFAMPTTVTSSSNKNNLPFGGFVFGANTNNTNYTGTKSTSLENTTVQPTTSITFGTIPATITVNSSTNSTTNDSPKVINSTTQSNIFGGIVSSSVMTSPITNTSSNVFAITNNNNNNNNNKSQSSNLFSSFSGNKSGIAATTQSLFGGSNSTATGFTFGLATGKSPLKTTDLTTSTATAAATVTTAATSGMAFTSSQAPSSSSTPATSAAWPKNNFIFGATSNETKPNEQKQQNQNTLQGASSMFAFSSTGNSNANANNTSSIFGAAAATATTSTSANNSNIFGSNVATPSLSGTIFGATAPTHVFGNANFGGVSSSSAPSPSSIRAATSIPTFGSASTSVTSPTFGGFGVLASNETKGATLEAKPPSSALSFTFGANNNTAAATTSNVGFNFSSAAPTKTSTAPVFNFGSVAASGTISQPTFNFTGINDQSQNVVKPFQFGATPSTPFYKFTGGATEVAPNAPFQFNAAPTPATNNIFAPNSMPGATTNQQTRRKIRPPVRRLTPR